MRRKLLICFFIIFLMTGCSASYNLTIDNNSFSEDIDINFVSDHAVSNGYCNVPSVVSSTEEYYDCDMTNNGVNYNIKYNYTYNLNSVNNGFFINRCYSNVDIQDTGDKIVLSTSDYFDCIYMYDIGKVDKVNINIKTDLKVLNNNADSISGNVYTWLIDETNYENKPILMEMQKDVMAKDIIEENDSFFTLWFVITFLIFVLVVAYVIIKIKAKRNNAI